MDEREETYMNFPIPETCEHVESPLPLSKRRHVESEEFTNDFPERSLVSEEDGEVPSGSVAHYDRRDLSNQESKLPSHEVLDQERREPTLNQPHHQTDTTDFDVFGREIPPSDEFMPGIDSHQPENNDEGQPIVGPCSPTDSLASGSRRLRELQISTPRTPTPPIVAIAQEETSQKPQTAQVVGSSVLCAACPIVDIRELPSQSRSLEEICNGREIPDGGLAVYVALPHVVRKMYDIHQKMLSLFGLVGLQNVYLVMPSSVKERFQTFMTIDVERLSENFKTMDLESDVAKHRKGRLDDVKALEPVVKFVHDLVEEAKIHVSHRIQGNLEDALKMCRKADDGSYLANVYQALEGKKGICLVEVYTSLCEMFPLVCLEGEKILLVVKEGLMKRKRLGDENIHLVTYDQHSYPVDDSSEVFLSLHQVRLVQPNHPHGGGSGVIFHKQPAQPTFSEDCSPNQPWSSQPFSAQDHRDLYQNPDPYDHSITHHQVGGFSSHRPNFRGIPPQPAAYFEPNKVPPPPPPPGPLYGVSATQIRHLGGNSTRYHPPYLPSPSIAGWGQRPPAVVGPGTAYRPSHVSLQSMDRQPWEGTRR